MPEGGEPTLFRNCKFQVQIYLINRLLGCSLMINENYFIYITARKCQDLINYVPALY